MDAHIHQTSRKSLNKCCLPERKLMAAIFWDRKEAPMVEFMQQGTTVTLEVYCKTLKKLHRAIQNKRRGMLIFGVMLLHDTVSIQLLILQHCWSISTGSCLITLLTALTLFQVTITCLPT
jgi:hypothetical protein